MRLPLCVAHAIRSRKLIEPGQRVLIALSGGPDSVALFHCMLELARKRDLAFVLSAAHLNHGLRGRDADADEAFCRELCTRHNVPLVLAYVDTPKLSIFLKRSKEESARIARHAFLNSAAQQMECACVAVAHHADDRIETLLYRLCRGTGLAGLQGIGWLGPLHLQHEPDVENWLQWRTPERDVNCAPGISILAVRPLLGCTREEILAYLRSKRQRYCTDETNFDIDIPRNALRNLVLPALEKKVHPGTRAALARLAEEAEATAVSRAWQRQWLLAFAQVIPQGCLALPVSKLYTPSIEELSDALEVLRGVWKLADANFTLRHAQALRALFIYNSGPKSLDLPGGLRAERSGKLFAIRRKL